MKTREKIRNAEHILYCCLQHFMLRKRMNIKTIAVIKDSYE